MTIHLDFDCRNFATLKYSLYLLFNNTSILIKGPFFNKNVYDNIIFQKSTECYQLITAKGYDIVRIYMIMYRILFLYILIDINVLYYIIVHH